MVCATRNTVRAVWPVYACVASPCSYGAAKSSAREILAAWNEYLLSNPIATSIFIFAACIVTHILKVLTLIIPPVIQGLVAKKITSSSRSLRIESNTENVINNKRIEHKQNLSGKDRGDLT